MEVKDRHVRCAIIQRERHRIVFYKTTFVTKISSPEESAIFIQERKLFMADNITSARSVGTTSRRSRSNAASSLASTSSSAKKQAAPSNEQIAKRAYDI